MRAINFATGVAAALVALGGFAAVSGALAAGTPDEPVIIYDGTLTVATVEGDSYVLTTTLTVDCSAEPCTALTSSTDGTYTPPLTNDQALPLADGQLQTALPEYGDLCALRWIGSGDLGIALTDSSATVSRSSAAGAPRPCGDGSTAEAAAATIAGTLTYRSGSVCLIDASCVVASATPTPTSSPSPVIAAEPTIGELIPWPDEPSVLSELPTPRQALTLPNAVWAVSAAGVLVLVVAFPSVLLDSATERLVDRFDERRARRSGRPRSAAAPPPLTVTGFPLALVGLLVAALASAYVDPDFGLDLVGARTVISVVASFIVTVALGWAFVFVSMLGGFRGSRPRIEFRPLTLLIVAAAVVFSRLTGFEPGIIFGLIAGVGFAAAVTAGARTVASMLGLVYVFVVGALGWIGYGVVLGAVGTDPVWGELLATETLAAIAIAGGSALPIALLPVRGLLGHVVWRWNRWLWAVAYLIAAAGFFLVLMPLPDSWQAIDVEIWAWAGAYVAFALGSVLIWLVVVRPWRRTT